MSKKIKKANQQLKRLSDSYIDKTLQEGYESALNEVSCLECANCCKNIGPSFNKKDISRISSYFNLSSQEFCDQFLLINDDGNYTLKSLPCVFLKEDNHCEIYHIKPSACEGFPYLNTSKLRGMLEYFEKHSENCPLISSAYEKI